MNMCTCTTVPDVREYWLYVPLHTHTHYTSLTFYTLSQIHAHSDDVSALNVEGESSHMIYSGGDDGLCKVHNTQSMYYYNNAYTTCILYDMFT